MNLKERVSSYSVEETKTNNNNSLKKAISITLSQQAIDKLEFIKKQKGNIMNRSQIIELLIKEYKI
ncbi:hypothetical protein ACNQ1M_01385 [Mycoplasma sp. VS424B]|uniref:hypothetical protein n=1 Tax=Mycoplasma sp. VS424B TaxID=3401660 RepID=UPI003AAE1C82